MMSPRPAPILGLLLLALAEAGSCSVALQTAAGIPGIAKRLDDPIVTRADFIGWRMFPNGTFLPSFCSSGNTVATRASIVACCPVGSTTCYFPTACSDGFLMKTITGATDTKTTGKVNCSLNDAPGLGCYHVVVYEEYVNQATNPFTYYKCTPTLSVLSPASYFQTLTPGAVAVASTPSYAPGETLVDLLLTITSAVRTSTAGTSTGPAARTGTTSKLPPTATTATPGSLSPDEDTASPSAEGLATSDKIAIGVGIGIGLPTILVGIMAWLYPRHRWGKGPVPVTFAVASSPSLQGPMQSLMQVGGGVATQGEGGYGGNGHNEGVAQGASRVFDGHAGEAVNQY